MGAKSSEHRTSTDKISSNPRTSDCETSMTTAEEGPVDPGPGRPKLYRTLSVAIILGFSLKNVLTICLEMAAISSILCSALCILPEDVNRVRMFSNLILVLAIGNLAQSTFGVRQSVMHSTSYILLCPILFYLNSPSNQCPGVGDLFAMGPEQRRILWTNKVQHLHGSSLLLHLFKWCSVYQLYTPGYPVLYPPLHWSQLLYSSLWHSSIQLSTSVRKMLSFQSAPSSCSPWLPTMFLFTRSKFTTPRFKYGTSWLF
uniref:Uncharacterized protein n=1 Tax=Cacopsylla melanoneura TaxID=428564 RepID=A0A8D8YIP6_9HEMI